MDKLRLDFYLSVGGELVVGDSFECGDLQKTITQVEHANRINHPGSRDAKIKLTSFAERENKGAQPVPFELPVIASHSVGDCINKAGNILWFDCGSRTITTWKPDYEALLKMQAEHDKHNESIIKACDEANKKESEVVYTQKMKDNGELPSVGMEVILTDTKGTRAHDFNNKVVKVIAVTEVDGNKCAITFSHPVKGVGVVLSRGMLFTPLKTPEQIELEEAKKKQLEDMCFKYENLPIEVAMQMQKNGDFPEIVVDDLNARGMAKQ